MARIVSPKLRSGSGTTREALQAGARGGAKGVGAAGPASAKHLFGGDLSFPKGSSGCRKWNQLRLGPKANLYVSTWFRSKLPASLRGRQDIRWGSFLSPRFCQRELFRPLDNGKG